MGAEACRNIGHQGHTNGRLTADAAMNDRGFVSRQFKLEIALPSWQRESFSVIELHRQRTGHRFNVYIARGVGRVLVAWIGIRALITLADGRVLVAWIVVPAVI